MKDNKEVVFMDVDQYQLILDNAQVGWWKADFEERCYICSDYLISLFGVGWSENIHSRFLFVDPWRLSGSYR